MRVGGDSVIHVDIRIIAATNQNLESLVRNNQFREDLFYRLDVLRINIPPLNQHREDIPLLVSRYMNRNFPGIITEPEVIQFLCQSDWTGNIRHLFNICERMAVLCSDGRIDIECARLAFPEGHPSLDGPGMAGSGTAGSGTASSATAFPATASPGTPASVTASPAMASPGTAAANATDASTERRQIMETLSSCRFNKGQTATMLGMSRSTLWRKMKEYHIEG